MRIAQAEGWTPSSLWVKLPDGGDPAAPQAGHRPARLRPPIFHLLRCPVSGTPTGPRSGEAPPFGSLSSCTASRVVVGLTDPAPSRGTGGPPPSGRRRTRRSRSADRVATGSATAHSAVTMASLKARHDPLRRILTDRLVFQRQRHGTVPTRTTRSRRGRSKKHGQCEGEQ